MKIIFYFHDESLRITGKSVREYEGHFDQEYLLVYMNPDKPWLQYTSRKLSEAEFERELELLKN